MSNKRQLRTEELKQSVMRSALNEMALNSLEGHKFKKLVRQGTIMEESPKVETCTPRS